MRQRQRGAHRYSGKFNSRGQRSMSKLHRGIDSGDVQTAFEKLEVEKRERAEDMHNRGLSGVCRQPTPRSATQSTG